MHHMVKLGTAGFAATTVLVLLGAVTEEVAQRATQVPAPSAATQEVAAAMTMSILHVPAPPAKVGATRDAAADTGATSPPRIDLIDLDLPPEPDLRPWSPPTWFSEADQDALWALDGVGQAETHADDLGPGMRLYSKSALVYDVDSGEVHALRADDRRPVASLTKVVAGLAAAESPDLEREPADMAVRPSWPGRGPASAAAPALPAGTVGAALVRSDNGAAYALADVAGLAPGLFVDRTAAWLGPGDEPVVLRWPLRGRG